MAEPTGKINQYVCPHGHRTTTVDIDKGVTPFLIMCWHPGCREMSQSSFYRVEPGAVPSHEWYRPDAAELERLNANEGMRKHVEKGGLVLRMIRPDERD